LLEIECPAKSASISSQLAQSLQLDAALVQDRCPKARGGSIDV